MASRSIKYQGYLYVEAADPKRDREFRQEAKAAYKKMIEYLSAPPNILRGSIRLIDGDFSFPFSEVDLKYPELVVMFEEVSEGNTGADFARMPTDPLFDYAITFKVIPEADLLEGDVDKIVRNFKYQVPEHVFTHEFIHYLDALRRKTPDLNPKEILEREERKKSRYKYLNNPEEFNSWYQAKVGEIEEEMEILQRSRRGLEFLLEAYLSSFDAFLKKALSHFDISRPDWGTEDLRKKWQRKLRQRLYKFYVDYKKGLQEKGVI